MPNVLTQFVVLPEVNCLLTSAEEYVLKVLRSSINDSDYVDPITGCDDEIIRIIILNGLLLTVFHRLSEPLQAKMRNAFLAGVVQSVQQQHEGNSILSRADELGLKCIALKGWELQKLYPHKNMRQMADIDILFKDYKYQKVKHALESLGYSSEPESSWMHDNFVKGRITVEAHKRLTDDSGVIQKWESQMWERATCVRNNIYQMSSEDYYIFHIIHLFKDFKGGMLGLRRIIDTWLLINRTNVNMYAIKGTLSQMGMQDFHNRILKLCNECMSAESLSEDSEVMIKHAFRFGIYGTDQTYKLGRIASMSGKGNMSLGMFKSALFAVLLPYSRMKAHFPILTKYPFLLPFCWIKRIIRIMHGENKHWAISKLSYGKIKQEDYEEMKRFFQAGGL
ncbi:MAG: nucleotidyltransferase family protein [Clostridia bacterium]|nr:nucleotidyltransferase family protein [Clostridia bacterium]